LKEREARSLDWKGYIARTRHLISGRVEAIEEEGDERERKREKIKIGVRMKKKVHIKTKRGFKSKLVFPLGCLCHCCHGNTTIIKKQS
jgi:hypothetical protein